MCLFWGLAVFLITRAYFGIIGVNSPCKGSFKPLLALFGALCGLYAALFFRFSSMFLPGVSQVFLPPVPGAIMGIFMAEAILIYPGFAARKSGKDCPHQHDFFVSKNLFAAALLYSASFLAAFLAVGL
ncbi:MAG: hypothetical protein ACP5E4_00100 [Candidatus Aenigmatarchaeota archaeon]